jgi:hypothetical protein
MKKLNSFAFLSLFAMAAFLVFSGDSIRVELFFSDGRKSEILEQHESTNPNPQSVVNCSQKLISLIFGTTARTKAYIRETVVNCSQKLISLIFGTTKYTMPENLRKCVVNCSQKLISLIFGTTRKTRHVANLL